MEKEAEHNIFIRSFFSLPKKRKKYYCLMYKYPTRRA